MVFPVQAVPVNTPVFIPFAELCQFVAHESQVLAGMRPLVCKNGAYACKPLPVITRHTPYKRPLPMDDFIM